MGYSPCLKDVKTQSARHYRGRSGRSSAILVALCGAGAGCSFLPAPPPLLPEPDQRFGVAGTVGRMYVPSRAEVVSPQTGPVTLRQTWDGEAAPGLPALFDPRLSVTVVASDRAQAAVHASWLSNGIELRYLTSAVGPDTPLFLRVGGQTDGPLLIPATGWPGFAWEARAGVSLQPSLGSWLRLLLGAAASFGPRRRAMLAPDESIGRNEADNIFPAELRVLRPELQGEALVGASLSLWSAVRVAVAVQPFYVFSSGTIQSACFMCADGVQVMSYQASWGLAVMVSAALGR
jgi:hypothetical protein